MDITDAYLHAGLSKYLPIEDVERTTAAAGVSRAVVVQHLGEYDNGYIRGIVERQPERFAGVCLVDHRSEANRADGAERSLSALLGDGPFRGARLTSDVLRESPGVFAAAADAGGIIVFYAPEGIAASADALEAFLKSHPDCRLVVTHLGNPSVRESPGFGEHRALFRLAAHAVVYLQISGMEMFCPYPHEALYPLIEEAAGVFGPERLLWGSNYPVVGGLDDYRRELDLLLEGRLPLPEEAIPKVAGGNAAALYFGG
ncbi:MAG: amidohydrolase family protein [Spirochaetaceae bacterium]